MMRFEVKKENDIEVADWMLQQQQQHQHYGFTAMMRFEVKQENDAEVADWMQQPQQQHQHYDLTDRMTFEVKNENDVEAADWMQQPQQQHQQYENYGKTEQVFDSQLPLCWYCSMFEGLPSLSQNGFSLPTLPQSPQPQVPNPWGTPVGAGCRICHHSYMETPFVLPDANNYSFTWNMSSVDSSISPKKSPAIDASLPPENTNTENPENPSSESNSDSDSSLKDTDVKGFRKRKRNSSKQTGTINGFSCFTREEKRQKLEDASASPLYDEFDSNSKVGRQKELRNSVGPASDAGIQVNNAVGVEVKLEFSEGETDDGVLYHGIMPELDELFPKDFDLTTAMLELLPKDLQFSNDSFFESNPTFGSMPFSDGFNPDV